MYLYLYIGHIYMSIMYMIDRYITSTSTAHQSIQMQEACGGRSGMVLQALGWEEGVPGSAKQGRQERSPHCVIL